VRVVATIAELRAACDSARAEGRRVGLVPTMGAFHAGHRSLMRAARDDCDFVVVSLFVNPTQFGAHEDLDGYPRDLEGDAGVAATLGVDVLFAPAVEEMYPEGPTRTSVHVAGLTDGLCGATRPGHFDGVTTIVTKLFAVVGPSHAYFGRKDFQQLAVIRRMVKDLDLPVEVVGCPLVRERDGVAMSSRNAYLSPDERREARVLSGALRAAAAAIVDGERDPRRAEAIVEDAVAGHAGVDLVYVELRDARTLERPTRIEGGCVLALAAQVGPARLLDNVVLDVRDGAVDVDLGVTEDEEHM
jgi:pantoate--beta-alanine ligase